MAEKRVKFIVDKDGNYRAETISGFTGAGCHQTIESITACVGGSCNDQGDKDDAYRNDDPSVLVDGLN
jgi:hypothetical protein